MITKLVCLMKGHQQPLVGYRPKRYFVSGLDCGFFMTRELKPIVPKGWRVWKCHRCNEVISSGAMNAG